MSSKVGPDPRLAVRIPLVSDTVDAVASLKDVHATAIAEAAKVISNLAGQVGSAADFAGSVAETADIAATAVEGGAATLEATRFQRLLGATRITPGQLTSAASHLSNLATVAGGLQAGFKSDNSTLAGKVTEGVAVAAGTKLMTTALSAVKGGNPVMLADMALNIAGEKILGAEAHKAAGGYVSGHVFVTPAKVLTAWGDALINGNDTALNKFADEARAGDHGAIYKGALGAGQYISDKLNVVDGIEATVNASKKVSQAVTSSVATAKASVNTAVDTTKAAAAVVTAKVAEKGLVGAGVEGALKVGQAVSDKLNLVGGIETAVALGARANAAWNKTVSFLGGR